MDDVSDESLAEAAARDEPGAFDRLARRYQVPLLRFLSRGAGRCDAEDALQETFARLFVGRRKYRADRPFRTWAFTIARRTAIDLARRRAARPPVTEPTTPPRADDPADRAADADARRSIWSTAANVLTEDQHRALWLFYAEGFDAGEVARVLGTTGLGARALLWRARQRLKTAIAPDGSPLRLAETTMATTGAAEVRT